MKEDIKKLLFSLKDEKYAELQRKIIPNIPPETIIGVRTQVLRKIAKQMIKLNTAKDFLSSEKHQLFDENQLHVFLICDIKEFKDCMTEVEKFLPFVNNWATCDSLSPKCFKNNTSSLIHYINIWLKSKNTYTVRFAIGMLMKYFLDNEFKEEYLQKVAVIKSEEYYIKMMQAWYFATALAKQYDSTVKILLNKDLEKWIHNKTIQKATESFRISTEQKVFLKTLRIK